MKIALCGSTRFRKQFEEWNKKLAFAGHPVYSLSCFGREASDEGKGENDLLTDDQKIVLDLVHLQKIMNSDAIVVVNPEGYIGFSTKREIQWAVMLDKMVFHTEAEFMLPFMPYNSNAAKDLL